MPALVFRTVPDDLVACAEAAHAHLRGLGYRVCIERTDHAAPFTPTMSATRLTTTLHIEVTAAPDLSLIEEWVNFGRTASGDTRLAVCLPVEAPLPSAAMARLRRLGVGLLTHDGEMVDSVAALDLAIRGMELPKLHQQPARVRELLGHAYEQWGRGEWRECFESACNALEEEARRYFARWSRTGRIQVQRKGKAQSLAASEINRLTLGQLARAFRDILSPSSLDVTIEQALTRVNPDRVERVHRRSRKATENRLRRSVGQHMWLIVNTMRQFVA